MSGELLDDEGADPQPPLEEADVEEALEEPAPEPPPPAPGRPPIVAPLHPGIDPAPEPDRTIPTAR